jgi:hypothetical protein
MRRREFKARKFEARRDAAANERPRSQAHRLLPAMRRNGELRAFPRKEIRAETMHALPFCEMLISKGAPA